MNIKLKAIILSIFLLTSGIAVAHSGGHGEKANLKLWHIQGQDPVYASFLTMRDENVYLEDEHGEIAQVKWADLSKECQTYINNKIARIEALNQRPKDRPQASELSFYNIGMMILIMLGIGLIVAIMIAKKKSLTLVLAGVSAMITLYACSDEDTQELITDALVPTPNDITEMNQAFAPYSNVTTFYDEDYYYVESNGIPDHQMMVNITAWIAQVPVPHDYTGDNAWSIPLKPQYAEDPISIESNFQRGAIAIAANGIPIFNPINASGLVSKEIGELDDFGGHSGRGDDYHYHAAPLHLESTSGNNPIAYALDGFAVYGSSEPDGSAMETLDAYHGHEDGEGGYHYHGTETYPFLIGAMRGEVSLEGDAPQTQITPQPVASPPRQGDPHGINSDNLIITDLIENNTQNGYLLKYTSDGIEGSVEYSWDENDLFTFIFHDVNGTTTTETWQR